MSGPIVLVLRILLALVLYGFLGLAIWTIWLDLKRTGIQVEQNKIQNLRLEIRIKKQTPFFRSFSQSEIFLGRDKTCDLLLKDESVSNRHAKISFHHGNWWVEDLKSTNGTKLNSDKLTTATVITNGDDIKCGNAHLVVNLVEKPVLRL